MDQYIPNINRGFRTVIKSAFALFLIVVLFSKFIFQGLSITFFKSIDELLLLFCVPILLVNILIKKRVDSWLMILGLVFIILAIISVLGPQFRLNSIVQIAIHLRLFIYFYILKRLFYNDNSILKMFFHLFIVLTFVGFLANVLLQENYQYLFNGPINYRFGLLRVVGFQLSYNNLGLSFMLFYIYLLSFRWVQRNLSFLIISSIALVILCLFTGTRTALIIIPISWFIIFQKNFSGYLKYALYTLFIGILISGGYFLANTDIVQLTIENLSQFNSETEYIRGLIVFNAFVLCLQYFPFGSGAATYGSIMSKDSEVYSSLGMNVNNFEGKMQAIFDSNFATIIGEFGLIGILIFTYLIYKLWKMVSVKSELREYYLICFIAMVLFSLTNPTLMNGYQSLLFAIMLSITPSSYKKAYK